VKQRSFLEAVSLKKLKPKMSTGGAIIKERNVSKNWSVNIWMSFLPPEIRQVVQGFVNFINSKYEFDLEELTMENILYQLEMTEKSEPGPSVLEEMLSHKLKDIAPSPATSTPAVSNSIIASLKLPTI